MRQTHTMDVDVPIEVLFDMTVAKMTGVLCGWFTRRILNQQMTKMKELAEASG